MTSTSSGPIIDLSKDDKVTAVTRWDVKLYKKPLYRIATAFYFCCCRCCHHCSLLLLLPPLLPPPSSTAAAASAVDCHCQLPSASGLVTAATVSHHPPLQLPLPPHHCDDGEFYLHCATTTTTTTTTMMTMTTKRTLSGSRTMHPLHFPISVGRLAAR